MPFTEGNSLGGRKKGSVNKATSKIRDAYTKLLEGALDQLKEDFKELEPKDRIKLYLDLSKYVIPQLKQTELTGSLQADIKPDLTPEEIRRLKDELLGDY